MPETDIDSASQANVGSALVDYSVPSESTDGAGDQGETTWISQDWNQNLGY